MVYFCKYILSHNFFPATGLKQVGKGATKNGKSVECSKTPGWNIPPVKSLINNRRKHLD